MNAKLNEKRTFRARREDDLRLGTFSLLPNSCGAGSCCEEGDSGTTMVFIVEVGGSRDL
jgi:hypothetical protein